MLERRGPRTVVVGQEVAFPAGTVRISDVDGDGVGELQTTNPSGGLLAGDRMDVALTARAGVRASITSQGANRVCGVAAGEAPRTTALDTTITVEDDAVLEWVPHHLVPYARSSVRQRTAVDVAPSAALVLWEGLSSGRIGQGERFAWASLDTRLRITRGGRPLLLDGAVLGPGGEPFDGADLVATVVGVLPVGSDAPAAADRVHDAVIRLPGVLAGASVPTADLVVARVVARDAPALYGALASARELLRRAVGLPAPRRAVS